ncbi:MAG: amidohydrolase family protein [Chitinophagaceae bacterium]
MKKILALLVLLMPIIISAQIPWQNSNDRDIFFQNVTLIPMDSERIIASQDLVIRAGKIVQYRPTGVLKPGKNDIIIDASGKYLMPGIGEMHAHVPPIEDLEPMKEVLNLFALNGVTTIRGMLGHPQHIVLRNKIQSGEIIGPRFITSGPSFNGNSVKTAEEGEKMVEAQKKAGYDFLKLHPGLNPVTFGAIAKKATELNIPFSGHVSYTVGVWRAIDAGYATIDHMDGFIESIVPGIENIAESDAGSFGMFIGYRADLNKLPALLKALKEKNIWVVPTQCLAEKWFSPEAPEILAQSPELKYISPDTRAKWIQSKKNIQQNPRYNAAEIMKFIEVRRKLILACQQNGVQILLGSDAPQVFDVPGFSAHDELAYYVLAGLSPYEALKTGTVNVGKFLGIKDLGIIKSGAPADLILLSGNPLTSINATRTIEGVMMNGKWLDKNSILSELKKLERK